MRQNAGVRSTRSVLSLVYLWTECDCWGSAGRQITAVDWLTDVRRASCSGDVRNDERHLSIVIVEMFRRHHNETSVPSVRSSQLRRYVWMCDRFLLSRLRSASVSPSLLPLPSVFSDAVIGNLWWQHAERSLPNCLSEVRNSQRIERSIG